MSRRALHEHIDSQDRYELAWSLDSMPEEFHQSLAEVLVEWVLDYNANFVVREAQLIPACWPAHPGLAREIAATYAHWMRVFHSSSGSAADATGFFDRTLPGFQDRIGKWLGTNAEACRAGQHPADWNAMTPKIDAVAAEKATSLDRLSRTYLPRLAETASAPDEAPPITLEELDVSDDSARELR